MRFITLQNCVTFNRSHMLRCFTRLTKLTTVELRAIAFKGSKISCMIAQQGALVSYVQKFPNAHTIKPRNTQSFRQRTWSRDAIFWRENKIGLFFSTDLYIYTSLGKQWVHKTILNVEHCGASVSKLYTLKYWTVCVLSLVLSQEKIFLYYETRLILELVIGNYIYQSINQSILLF